ncbi:xylulokinase [Homoserinibacter sp. YIM 151385]|uniref:xylulokinase n=1 Tax=Homoserinibacter sp. YIM 151385 TaxID=2985506 RepID=UPI0022F0D2E8|nr:FGGY-family carbohydrate kinase [Homoserinibacter sp. YIM 151385]WBU37982.1 FGGY-family carbohydrate kinase [Homoserinibacter sp. YIM 151385]
MAFDFGTTSLKAAVVETDGGIIAEANARYAFAQPHPGWAEQDPDELWRAACAAGREARSLAGAAPRSIDAVVIVAPWKNIIPVAADGTRLHDAIIWMDGRARAEAAELELALGSTAGGTGQEYWPRLMWLRERMPDVWAGARWLMGLTTYLTWRATGAVVTDPSDDFIRMPPGRDTSSRDRILAAAGLEPDLGRFAEQVPSAREVGRLHPAAAGELGLAPGTRVLSAFGDIPAVTIGAGPLEPGAAHIYFGTSSWLAVVADAREPIEAPLAVAVDAQHDVAVFPLQTGCLAVDWIVEQLYGAEQAHLDDRIHELVNAQIAEIPPGSGNLLATHWLNGELPPLSKSARGVFLGLTTSHDRRHMVRAVMESLCYTHRASIERLEAQTGRRLDEVRVVGGGAVSEVWMQMLADVLRRRVVVPDRPRATGVLGAAICALAAEAHAGDLAAASRSAAAEAARGSARVLEPDPAAADAYDRMFALSMRIHPALAELFVELDHDPAEAGA